MFKLSNEIIILSIKDDPKTFLTGYIYNFSINGLYSLYLALSFIVLTSILTLISLIGKNNKVTILSFFFIAHFSNIFVVSLIEPVINRYKFFTEIPLITICFIFILSLLFPRDSNNNNGFVEKRV